MSSQPDRRDLLNLMSECLQLLRQLPSTLQHLHKQNSKPSLVQLAETALKFSQLGTKSNQQITHHQISLFHRFGCKVLDVSSICLNHCTNALIRQLFIGLGDRISGLKATGKSANNIVSHSLLNIASFIDSFMSKIMAIEKLSVSKSTILQIITSKQKSDIKVSKQTQRSLKSDIQARTSLAIPLKKIQKLEETDKCLIKCNSQKQFTSRAKENMNVLGIGDLDFSHTQKIINKNQTTQQIYEECLNRNKFINQLIKQYQSKHQMYVKKPLHKRNRENPCYQPTSIDKNSITNKKRINKFKTKKTEHSRQPELTKKTIMNDVQAITEVAELKQSLLNQVYSYQRKQYFHINKVKIGEQEQQPPLHFAIDFPNVMHEKSNNKIAQRTHSKQAQSQRLSSSKTQRMKTLALTLKNSSSMKTKDRLESTALITVGFK